MKSIACLTLLTLPLTLAACGGGSTGTTGVASVSSAASYTKLANLTGNQAFQSGGVHWSAGSPAISNPGKEAFGQGVVLAYNAATDTFTLTAPDGTSGDFSQMDLLSAQSNATTRMFRRTTATGVQQFTLVTPTVAGVPLSYTQFATFLNSVGPVATTWVGVGGVPTAASDMPRTGSATYSAETTANVITASGNLVTTTGTSATFSADFGAGTVGTSVHLVATSPLVGPLGGSGTPTDFGTFTGSGTIASGGPGFSGSFAGTTGAGFSGAFFGPQASEMGYAFHFSNGTIDAVGITRGVKQ